MKSMKRSKRHKVKQEMPDASTSQGASQKEHDLAYYIHDRVELMHQVFSVLKAKEIKAMAPECVRHISTTDLQELCMEELLGISSKRLCAILDGAEPPSDTESSESSPELETISLDSISSDDEILSQVSSKRSKKHKHRSKAKKKRKRERVSESNQEQEDRSRRAGLTMLELLELQARARAIRAQLQKEQAVAASTENPKETVAGDSSDGEVEIKEEAAEVVEISSSEDEKPNVQQLEDLVNLSRMTDRVSATRQESESGNQPNSSKTITKKVNDLVITVPQAKSSRKIKLKRNAYPDKALEKDNNATTSTMSNITAFSDASVAPSAKRIDVSNVVVTKAVVEVNPKERVRKNTREDTIDLDTDSNDKTKSNKKKKKKKEKQKDKDGSDHDEIMLQLSDTEKMDLLEDLEGKKSSDSEDSSEDSDSKSDSEDENQKRTKVATKVSNAKDRTKSSDSTEKDRIIGSSATIQIVEDNQSVEDRSNSKPLDSNAGNNQKDIQTLSIAEADARGHDKDCERNNLDGEENSEITPNVEVNTLNSEKPKSDNGFTDAIEVASISDIPIQNSDDETQSPIGMTNESEVQSQIVDCQKIDIEGDNQSQNNEEITVDAKEKSRDSENVPQSNTDEVVSTAQATDNVKTTEENDEVNVEPQADCVKEVLKEQTQEQSDLREKSEGELSDRDSSEVEVSDVKSEIVCISDDEKVSKKKKKKDKKSKKEKKSKKKKDFRESADQNFYTEVDDSSITSTKDDVAIISEANERQQKQMPEDNNRENVKIENCAEVTVDIEANTNNEIEEVKLEITPKAEVLSSIDVDDDVYEILELSDSSCYEVEEISISKEPTTEEIEALSAKIDKIEQDGAIGNETIENESTQTSDIEDVENVSWKDRYLKSSKVKKVLTTASILNVIRKKNLELKKKLQESKQDKTEEKVTEAPQESNLEEGSIQHYNTLEASTKYVDPIKETEIEEQNDASEKTTVTTEMKKDAKQLLKMYKMLLKYNDINKLDDLSKKKKKKKKSKKDKGASKKTEI